jgi:hypothetical protein
MKGLGLLLARRASEGLTKTLAVGTCACRSSSYRIGERVTNAVAFGLEA